MFIRSERLFLRPGWPEDWEDLLGLIKNETVVRNLASVPWPYSAQDARAFLQRPQKPLLPHFIVTLPTANGSRLIGGAGLDRDGDDIGLGYWIGPAFWGRGYATEAAGAVLGLARALGHERIVASHFADNPRSGTVLRKLGFTLTSGNGTRFSSGRGEEAPALTYAIDLGQCCDCDGPDDNEGASARMAA